MHRHIQLDTLTVNPNLQTYGRNARTSGVVRICIYKCSGMDFIELPHNVFFYISRKKLCTTIWVCPKSHSPFINVFAPDDTMEKVLQKYYVRLDERHGICTCNLKNFEWTRITSTCNLKHFGHLHDSPPVSPAWGKGTESPSPTSPNAVQTDNPGSKIQTDDYKIPFYRKWVRQSHPSINTHQPWQQQALREILRRSETFYISTALHRSSQPKTLHCQCHLDAH